MTEQPILWEHLEPGSFVGEITQAFDASLSKAWRDIFGGGESDDAAEAAGITVAMMMRAYLNVVSPRPPGGVHARQRFTLEALPTRGEAIRTTVGCRSKELKRERRYVDLEVRGTGKGGRPIYSGLITVIWAA